MAKPGEMSVGDFPSQDNFHLVYSVKTNNLIPVHKYKSHKTGLTVVLADVEGPVVNGYFCLATEAHDDDGLPHTLEHLIFLGSEDYPYKGVLDLLANRCLASGTNAWTDTDHTCYTMTTAGSEGFLTLLPIYLDHILYPTLTDAGFTTEVHHVNGKGEDAGVVYCEMQSRENTGESRTHLAMLRAIYPGRCGYKSETGGIMRNLRESTSNDKVRNYHKEFYRPENLCLVITGQVQAQEVFAALKTVEEKIVVKGDREQISKPWQSPIPTLETTVDDLIPYPCDEEDRGMVCIAWRGAQAVGDLYSFFATMMLMECLTETSVSILKKAFVEIEDPYASNVRYSVIENAHSTIYLMFENVPKKKLELVKLQLFDVLGAIAEGKEKIDMKHMNTVIHRSILEQLSNMENNPHDSIAFMAIGDMLYGCTEQDLYQRLNQIQELQKLNQEPAEFWVMLLRQYLIDAPSVTIRGLPSIEEMKNMTESEKSRVQKQQRELGEMGLKAKEEEVERATEKNDVPAPESVITSVSIPGTSSIHFHPISSFTSKSQQQHPKFSLMDLPVDFRLDDVHTNFVYLILLVNTNTMPEDLRPCLPLFLEVILESPIKRNGAVIPYEQVVAELAADTLQVAAKLGLDDGHRFSCGTYAQTAMLFLQVEEDKYCHGVTWLHELLTQTQFRADRLRIIATKMLNDVAQLKRKGNRVTHVLMKDMCFSKNSNHYVSSMIRQQAFLTKFVETLDQDPEAAVERLEKLRQILADPSNLTVHMAASVDRLAQAGDISQPWKKLFPENKKGAEIRCKVTWDSELLHSIASSPVQSCVLGLGSTESSFLVQTTSHNVISSFTDPDLPALLVLLQYLCQCEGPLWRQIRGLGLAYGYSLLIHPEEGLMYFSLYRCTHVVAAYKEAHGIVEAHLSGADQWEETLLDSARSCLIFELIDREKSIGSVVIQSLLRYFKQVNKDYNRQMLNHISNVTASDLKRVGRKFVAPLFDTSTSRCAVVCHPSKVAEVISGFKEFKRELKLCTSLEESFLGQWETPF